MRYLVNAVVVDDRRRKAVCGHLALRRRLTPPQEPAPFPEKVLFVTLGCMRT
jgi:hypothetical protein